MPLIACKINDSTIHLYTNLNGQQSKSILPKFVTKYQTDPNNSLFNSITDLNCDFDPFEILFNDLNNLDLLLIIMFLQLQSGGDTVVMGGYGSQNRGPAQTPSLPAAERPLDEYGINITEIARQGNVDPVIGRDEEIIRVIEILNRRTKNNPSTDWRAWVLVRQQLSKA